MNFYAPATVFCTSRMKLLEVSISAHKHAADFDEENAYQAIHNIKEKAARHESSLPVS